MQDVFGSKNIFKLFELFVFVIFGKTLRLRIKEVLKFRTVP